MHVAVDLDDVVLDFVGGLRDAVRKEYAVEIPADDVDDWDLHKILDPVIGRSWWSWLRDREWLWATFPAVDGAIGGIDTLRRQGHYMELVTSKPQWAEHAVWKWLGLWRPAFQRVTIVGGEDNKADFTVADILIDDKPENCVGFMHANRRAVLYDRPHNRRATAHVRARSWAEVIEEVNR